MVANLARENEARLRAHGHSITAGRLYLAHFLGPEGAHQALAAPGGALVADVLGAQVVSANRFLTGKDCAYVIAWAEKKMTGKAMRYTVAAGRHDQDGGHDLARVHRLPRGHAEDRGNGGGRALSSGRHGSEGRQDSLRRRRWNRKRRTLPGETRRSVRPGEACALRHLVFEGAVLHVDLRAG